MNRDFTDKKAIFVWKKKFVQSVSPEKKIPAQAVGKEKNSCKLKIPLPPYHFSNGPSLNFLFLLFHLWKHTDCFRVVYST